MTSKKPKSSSRTRTSDSGPKRPGGRTTKAGPHKYGEGTWFAVPLKRGGYAVGIIARGNPKTSLICYFFGPRRSDVPSLSEVETWKAADALCVEQVGDLGLLQGDWPIIGHSQLFRRDNWPMPVFVFQVPALGGFKGWTELRYYSEDNPLEMVGKQVVRGKAAEEALKNLPEDGLSGAEASEIGLDLML
jgi:hypothetical protein